jgi:transcription initiation factor TFIID subunit TAF12
VHGLALETKLAAANNDAATKAQVIRQTFGLDKVVQVKRATLIKVLQDRLKAAGLASGDAEVADLKKIAETLNRELGGEASSKKLASLGAAKHQAQQLTSALLLLPLYN